MAVGEVSGLPLIYASFGFESFDITEREPQVQFPTRGINAPPSTNITLLSSVTATQKVNMWTFEHYLDV